MLQAIGNKIVSYDRVFECNIDNTYLVIDIKSNLDTNGKLYLKSLGTGTVTKVKTLGTQEFTIGFEDTKTSLSVKQGVLYEFYFSNNSLVYKSISSDSITSAPTSITCTLPDNL